MNQINHISDKIVWAKVPRYASAQGKPNVCVVTAVAGIAVTVAQVPREQT